MISKARSFAKHLFSCAIREKYLDVIFRLQYYFNNTQETRSHE